MTWAVRLMKLGAVVSFGSLLAALEAAGETAPTWAMLAATEVALWLVMTRQIAGGRAMARFFGTVLAVLNVLFTIGMFAGEPQSAEPAPLVAALFLGNAVLGSAIVGMLWTPTAEPHFD
ncbi:hypothetical protein [Spelaeicoccus albus]|uniref:Heme/copper-type cytochrome/quinol oxidase subunit 4 n=1 Tax=Spelaeicoccus albus TaxID=1280376 RepID=A0A7Z0AAB2_9MICO|nr:hypothetical protein [Spelaeicoccus albus]NYI67202.1 heme/copper-type cytochrome/quinol oxidase subunit 4 [Spelaeicoccus albus]